MTSWLSPRACDDGTVQRKVECRFQDRRSTLEVVDGLEQRHDADRRVGMFRRRVQQPGLLEQHRRLEHVRHRLAHRDDVVRHGRTAEDVHRPRGRGDDVEFLARQLRQFGVRGRSAAGGWPARRPAPRPAPAPPATRSRDAPRPTPAARRRPPRARRSSAAGRGRTGETRRRAPLPAAAPAGRRRARRCRWRAATHRRHRGRPAARPGSRSACMSEVELVFGLPVEDLLRRSRSAGHGSPAARAGRARRRGPVRGRPRRGRSARR